MAVIKFIGSPKYKTPNFREKHIRNVTVDAEGTVYLYGNEASAIVVETRYHFFQEVTTEAEWGLVRERYGLPKKMRHSNFSHGVRRSEGSLVGLFPSSPIHIIQEQRGKEAGETSWRIPRFTKAQLKEINKTSEAAEPYTGPISLDECEDDIPF